MCMRTMPSGSSNTTCPKREQVEIPAIRICCTAILLSLQARGIRVALVPASEPVQKTWGMWPTLGVVNTRHVTFRDGFVIPKATPALSRSPISDTPIRIRHVGSEGRPLFAPGWLPAKVDSGGWLDGVLLLGQNELAGSGNAQDVLLPCMQ
jgi:hypothetical protein